MDDFRKHRKLSGGSQERVGELIKEGSAKQLLRSARNRQVVFNIPFSPEILERLREQPRSLVKPTSGNMTPDEIQLLKEQETKSQIFFFYPVINIYDAKLKKNIIIPQPFSWAFSDYPSAQFEIRVEVNSDGGYSANSSLPTRQPSD